MSNADSRAKVLYASQSDFDQVVLQSAVPVLVDFYVFHAYSLADLRDCYWLNRPPGDLGAGYQGFDLRYAVNCRQGVYAKEEGNYGKLLRVWQEGFPHRPADTSALGDTECEYVRFKRAVITDGFSSLCRYHLPRLSGSTNLETIHNGDGEVYAVCAGQYAFVLKSRADGGSIEDMITARGITRVVVMTDKYSCAGFVMEDGGRRPLFSGQKPKMLPLLFRPA